VIRILFLFERENHFGNHFENHFENNFERKSLSMYVIATVIETRMDDSLLVEEAKQGLSWSHNQTFFLTMSSSKKPQMPQDSHFTKYILSVNRL